MQLYNFARATFRQVQEPKVQEEELALFLTDFPDTSYKVYVENIRCQLEEQLENTKLSDNTSFDVELFSNVDLSFEDFNQIYNSITSAIIGWLTKGDAVREQEWRLSAPHRLYLIYTQTMRLLNYKTRIDCFNIRVFYKDYEISMTEC